MADGIRDLQTALRLNPSNLAAANNLSICYIQGGQIERARELLSWVLARDPSYTAARDNLQRLERSQPSPR
jgi:tetratricopeptide (TPR) repeat protein